MKKVLIIGPSFFNYNESISRAFKDVGFCTKIVPYDEPIHPFTLWNAFIHKFSLGKARLKDKSRKAFNQYICKVFISFGPDLVFIYNGDILDENSILYFKKSAKVAIWMLDGIYRHPQSEALAPLVDAYFCFEQDDVKQLQRKSINAYFLPQACDASIYYPTNTKKDIDILFVGTLYNYPNRIRLLKEITNRFSSYKIEIYGVYKPFYKNPLTWLFREKKDVFKNRNVSPSEVNILYNRAKITLNIHHEQSSNGANPKVFEIAGADAFQIVDWNPYIESVFSEGEVALFRSDNELFDLIKLYLSKETDSLSEASYRIITDKHLFIHRIKKVIDILYNADNQK